MGDMLKRHSNCEPSRIAAKGYTSVTALSLAIFMAASPSHAGVLQAVFSSHTHGAPATDINGVNLATGQFSPPSPSSSIGTSDSGMAESIGGTDFPNGSRYVGGITGSNPHDDMLWARQTGRACLGAYVYFGGYRKGFQYVPPPTGLINGHFVADDGSADILDPGEDADMRYLCQGGMTLTTSDGTVVEFNGAMASDFTTDAKHGVATQITKPDGEVIVISHHQTEIPTGVDDPNAYPGAPPEYFVDSYADVITSSLGWSMGGSSSGGFSGYNFVNRSTNLAPTSSVDASGYYGGPVGTQTSQTTPNSPGNFTTKQRVTKGVYVHAASGNYVYKQYVEDRINYQVHTFGFAIAPIDLGPQHTNVLGDYMQEIHDGDAVAQWAYQYTEKAEVISPSGVTTTVLYYTPPDDYSKGDIMYGGCPGDWGVAGTCVKSVTKGSSVWKYTWSNGSVDVEDPAGNHRHVTAVYDRIAGILVSRDEDELGRVTLYEHNNPASLLTKVTYPEGNSEEFIYNSRNNLTEIRSYPKGGGTPIVQTAGYVASCTLATMKTCNQPTWTKDAKGNQTDYTYSSTHGGVETVTLPADANGVRLQTRNVYTQVTAKIKVASTLVDSTPVWRLHCTVTLPSTVSSNATTCATSAQYPVTTYAYVHNNVLLTAKTISAGDLTQPLTTSYGYDNVGNVVWTDGPRTDVDDKRYTTYDDFRRPVYEIGPDPDGAGSLKRAMVHHLYDTDFREYRTETGTGNATDGSDFVLSTYKLISYDLVTGLAVKSVVGRP